MTPGRTIKRVPLDTLQLDPANARLHPDENVDATRASLARFGQVEPLVVQQSSGRIIGGNCRAELLRELGFTEADIVEVDIDDAGATALALALNRTAELATWHAENLAAAAATMAAQGIDMADLGFGPGQLDALLKGLTPPSLDDWGDAVGNVPDGDKNPLEQMTFTLTADQAGVVRQALERAKAMGPFVDTGNENSNGNALARVAEFFHG